MFVFLFIDFGLSNVLPNAGLEAWEQTGMCPLLLTTHCGSPAYAAPELLAQKPYGAQIDIWSMLVTYQYFHIFILPPLILIKFALFLKVEASTVQLESSLNSEDSQLTSWFFVSS